MIDHSAIKGLAKLLGRPLPSLIAMIGGNDPFVADQPARRRNAEWFANIYYQNFAGRVVHTRRVHYWLLGETILTPLGQKYENTSTIWRLLVKASRDARYLNLVPADKIVDRRNAPPQIFAVTDRPVEVGIIGGTITGPDTDFPDVPELYCWPARPPDPFLLELWCEKSTMNDILLPLCQRYGLNFVAGAGQMSEKQTGELMARALASGKPTRVFYISDFDPAGRDMPVAVARRIEFYLDRSGAALDFKLIPLGLSPAQVKRYDLKRIPIKDTVTAKKSFEKKYGVGATELDALEGQHPGVLRKLVDDAIGHYHSADYARQFHVALDEYREQVRTLSNAAPALFDLDLDDLRQQHGAMIDQWDEFNRQLESRFAALTSWLEANQPAPFEPPPLPPASEFPDEEVLYDSQRDYCSQIEAYQSFDDGGAGKALEEDEEDEEDE